MKDKLQDLIMFIGGILMLALYLYAMAQGIQGLAGR